jgi:hypothetical protein
MELIHTRAQFVDFARRMGVRPDWHEPDEQGLTARVEGTPLDFDNAGSWPAENGTNPPAELRTKGWEGTVELHVIFSEKDVEAGKAVRGRDIACVNLATLCAWASEPCAASAEVDDASWLG